jgi:pimeloyl-ACP methyl ester carboxylesterase
MVQSKQTLLNIHVVECGTGPLVLFVHGFPESWYLLNTGREGDLT